MHLRCCLLVPCVRGLLGPGGWDVVGDGRKQAVSGTSPQHTSTPSGPFKRIVWRSCSDSPTPYDSGRVCRERIMPLSAPLPYPNPAACGHSSAVATGDGAPHSTHPNTHHTNKHNQNEYVARLNRAQRTHTHTQHRHDTHQPSHTHQTDSHSRAGNALPTHASGLAYEYTDRDWWCCDDCCLPRIDLNKHHPPV